MFNYKERKEIHYKRIILEGLTIKLSDPYVPSTWQLLQGNGQCSPLCSESLPLLLSHLPDQSTCFDIDHDEKGRRKYLRLSDLIAFIKQNQQFKFNLCFLDFQRKKKSRLLITESWLLSICIVKEIHSIMIIR